MTHGDGGKGSARRPGDGYQDNWERIFGKKDIEDQLDVVDDGDDERTNDCPRCGTEMCVTGTHLHWHCDVCGYSEKIKRGEP